MRVVVAAPAGLAVLAAAAILAAQPPVAVPSPGLHPTPAAGTVESSSIDGRYGPPEPAGLDDVLHNASSLQNGIQTADFQSSGGRCGSRAMQMPITT